MDTWSFLTADDNWWQYVSHEYADTCQEYSPSGYMSGFDDGITNGYQWYPVAGGRQDYMNYYHHCREVTMEISNTKLIPESQIAAHWEYNRRSLLNYMEQVLFGISGLVTDATTGLPVEAEVYVLNHESENSWVYSEPETGNYHRLLYSGTYDVQFSAPCHETLVVNNVAVSNKTTTVLDVQLNPLQATVDFTTASTTAGTGDVIIFSDLSCGTVLNWDWQISGPGPANFINGTTSGTQNPEVQFDTPGLYTVSLTITTPSGDLTETKTDYITILECIYCPSSAADPTEEWISNVSFNTINNSTGGENGYENYTSISTDVEIENTYGLSVNIESTGSWVEHCVAYIDWNRNCDFSDAGEAIYLGSNQGSGFLFQNITIPDNATPGITRLRISLRWSNIPGPCDQFNYGEVEDYSLVILEPEIELDLKVFLEGPFDNPVMATVLNDNGHLPLSQPYTAFPWNYQGTENTTSIPLAAVDWILVEIHDASDAGSVDASTMVDQKAGFVLSDGSVVDIEGTSNVIFNHLMDNQLYVVLRHRNHLDILSSTAISEQAGLYVYDFTTSADKVYGGAAGYKEFTSGLWGMVSGDADANGIINSLDKSSHWITEAGKMGYLISDLNLDGQSENRDKNDSWQANNGMTGFPLAK